MTLYHGTRRGFARGGVIFPRLSHGGPGTGAPVNEGQSQPAEASEWVYATENLDLAWVYAFHAPGRGKPKVLVVEPRGEVEQDPEHSPHMRAWRCEWAGVVKVLTEPTISEEEARAGWQMSAALSD